MIEHPIEGDFRQWVVNAFRQSPLFATLDPTLTEKVMGFSRLVEFEANEAVLREGERPENFWVVLMGEVVIDRADRQTGERVRLAQLAQNDSLGELGLLLERPRTATATCTKQTYTVQFDQRGFDYLMDRIPGFARRLGRTLAERLATRNLDVGFPEVTSADVSPTPDLVKILPPEMIQSHKVFPVVDHPRRDVVAAVRGALGGLELQVRRIQSCDHDQLMERFNLLPEPVVEAVIEPPSAPVPAPAAEPPMSTDALARVEATRAMVAAPEAQLPLREGARPYQHSGTHTSVIAKRSDLGRIEPLVRQMIDVNASDLHLSALQVPRWRIDGDIYEIPNTEINSEGDVMELLAPVITGPALEEFQSHHDADFAFAIEGLARFRVNIFRDENGISAALRLIPMHTPSMEQLGLPKAARTFTGINAGLVLVCGPTGSGKSTTLSAMIDYINVHRPVHIVTIEDPIEFQHTSKTAMVTQREVGKNALSFQRGLRASLREDPDVVLVGELRERATLELALQTAQTGHLVLSTLHTSTAIGTVDRIIDMFGVDQHAQVRSVLADVLKGVINQHLCKRTGGGRIAAFECLVGGTAVSNCIRQGKNHQIATIMTTNKSQGHRLMNEDLAELFQSKLIDAGEALSHSPDRKDLRARLGVASG